jgi:hypothetical protein
MYRDVITCITGTVKKMCNFGGLVLLNVGMTRGGAFNSKTGLEITKNTYTCLIRKF